MNSSQVKAKTSGIFFVEEHRNTITRYFNGRKYTVQIQRDFYQTFRDGEFFFTSTYTFAVYFRFVTVNPGSHRIGSKYRSFSDIRPTNLMRAMADMIPDDSQAVPF